MRYFLQQHDINPDFATTLRESRNPIFEVLQLPDYISNTQSVVTNRVQINNVTPFERRLWNKLVTKQTPQETQRAIKEFIKLALDAI